MPSKKRKKYNKKELEKFRKDIIAERDRIIEELDRINELITSSAEDEGAKKTYSNHLADQGTDGMEKEKLYSYASQKDSYLRALNEAMERLERGIYGKCDICGDLIPKRRLNVVPSARLCITCKSDQESGRKER
ncbi:MAG: TraR/DksA family transcriptional regulator [Candidatus Krumholzibacteriota bacterium]|nr:TraR/DksA family transcriptional regulator [Candidatus Krumholzibacteriota bacterium]